MLMEDVFEEYALDDSTRGHWCGTSLRVSNTKVRNPNSSYDNLESVYGTHIFNVPLSMEMSFLLQVYLLAVGCLSINFVHLFDWHNVWPFNITTVNGYSSFGHYSSINASSRRYLSFIVLTKTSSDLMSMQLLGNDHLLRY